MKNRILLLLAVALMISYIANAQATKPFTFTDIMKFQTIQTPILSANGQWTAYSVVPERGDGYGIIQSNMDTTSIRIERGISPVISRTSEWAAFKIKPKAIETENAEQKNKPKPGVSIINLNSKAISSIDNVAEFIFSNDSKWFVYKPGEENDKKPEDDKKNQKKLGSTLILRHLSSGTDIPVQDVTEYHVDSTSTFLFYTISEKSGKRDGIYYRELKTEFCPEYQIYKEQNYSFANIAWSKKKDILAFTSSQLSKDGEAFKSSLWTWDSKTKSLNSALPVTGIDTSWYLPLKNSIEWSDDGSKLYFGLKPVAERFKPDEQKTIFNDTNYYNLDTILKKREVRVWHWNDDLIIPNQEKNWDNIKDKTYLNVYYLDSSKVIRLGDTLLPEVEIPYYGNYTWGINPKPYMKEVTWDGWYFDVYKVDIRTGDRKLIAKRVQEHPKISPEGNYIVFFDKGDWFIYDNVNDSLRNATSAIDVKFYDEENDTPGAPLPYGFGGWLEGDQAFYAYDMYDIWAFPLKEFGFANVTAGLARDNFSRNRFIRTDPDKKFYTVRDTIFLSTFNEKLKTKGINLLQTWIMGAMRKIQENCIVNFVAKAKDTSVYLMTKERYDQFPDLWLSGKDIDSNTKITNLNKQIEQFNWGKTELVSWKNNKGQELEGYIIKPGNYDSGKKYPVIIYFYERFSDRLNEFTTPKINHRPCYQLYSSDGYVMFMPDIKYTSGNPGYDATDCLITGARKLVDMGIADSNAIGIQGHSWGGYETAFIVTQTNMFKAAVAGAPVGNMTSAYSGIRLGTGLARQFQYEKEQSRIGGNLWDSLSNYINNSPVFKAQGINTPLMLMFGDEDEAVPWEQGIEIYLALRRLGKNCIFLQYQKEPHHPRKVFNQLDYAIKMKEFFDYHLKGNKPPLWILDGVDFKGK
jgi:dipeptidyl aminopeptidase/acylaminoacyl peptidase